MVITVLKGSKSGSFYEVNDFIDEEVRFTYRFSSDSKYSPLRITSGISCNKPFFSGFEERQMTEIIQLSILLYLP